jgi:proline dehydrogenase
MMPVRKTSPQKTLITLPLFAALVVLSLLLYQNGATWLRSVLIYLSHAKWARDLVTRLSFAKRVSGRFVAGETIGEVVEVARTLNLKGMTATLDFLGESVSDKEVAVASADEIVELLDNIDSSGVNANVSVKMSQLGLRIDEELALENMRRILEQARGYNNKVRIDMEESDVVDITLDIYRKLRDDEGYDNVGVVIQAYLYRSAEDVERLVDEGAWIRLCKGAYAEPPDIAFPKKGDTDRNFVKLAQFMLSDDARERGGYLGIATHDENMIDASLDYVNSIDIPSEEFEFQMLYGIRRDLQKALVDKGYKVRIYVPYGTAWYPYLVRRLAEHPANLWFFISNLFRR